MMESSKKQLIRDLWLLLLLVAILFAMTGCSKKKALCDSSSDADKTECKIDDGLGGQSVLFNIDFESSVFYDQNTASWTTISSSDLKAGTVSSSINIYSDVLSTSVSSAISLASGASAQKSAATTSSSTTQFSRVPYIAFAGRDGVTYSFRYQKINTSGTIVSEKIGQVTVTSGRAIIPIVNSMFDNQMYSSSSSLGDRFKNVISISPQTQRMSGEIKKVTFETVYVMTNLDFTTQFSTAITDGSFNLDTRWNYFVNPSTLVPNSDFPFFTLKDKSAVSQSVYLDAKVIFHDPPKIEMVEDVFYEMPFQFDYMKLNIGNLSPDKIVPERGNKFFNNTITLSTNQQFSSGVLYADFGYKLKLGSTQLTSTMSGTSVVFVANNLAPGQTFDLGFSYDFTQATNYNGYSAGQDTVLSRPLRPICYDLEGSSYLPTVKDAAKSAAESAGNFYAICELSTTSKDISVLSASRGSRMDTWFKSFSYAPSAVNADGSINVGHLYGIRKLTLRASGCLKVLVSAAGANSYALKTQGGSNCGDGTSDTSWTQFSVEKVYTIYDNTSQYQTVNGQDIGLAALLEKLKASSPETDSGMLFNGERLNVNATRRLY